MNFKNFIVAFFLAFAVSEVFAQPEKLVITGEDITICQKNSNDYSGYIKCLESRLAQAETILKKSFGNALELVQSEDWLLPNIDYKNEKSAIVAKNRELLAEDQTSWSKHKDFFCALATSQISENAQNHYPLLMQCKINLTNTRVNELTALIKQAN